MLTLRRHTGGIDNVCGKVLNRHRYPEQWVLRDVSATARHLLEQLRCQGFRSWPAAGKVLQRKSEAPRWLDPHTDGLG